MRKSRSLGRGFADSSLRCRSATYHNIYSGTGFAQRPMARHHRAVLATTLNWQPRRDVSLDARIWFCRAPMARGGRAARFFIAGGAAGWIHHLCRVPFRENRGDLMASGTFLSVNHYRFYELDHSDHIEAGYSVECGSDTDAMRAADRLLGQGPAAGLKCRGLAA